MTRLVKSRRIRLGFALAILGGLASVASPAAGATDLHQVIDVVGAVFPCAGGDLTVTSGYLIHDVRYTVDAQGVYHVSLTSIPRNLTLTDGAATYTITGADHQQASFPADPNAPFDFHAGDNLEVHTATGALYAQVRLLIHIQADHTFGWDVGSCSIPH
jgi:hypothetical protein